MNGRRQPSLPPKIPGFEYVGLLGMGGFADVFEYRQDFPRRSVAVKVLLSTSLDAGARESFFTEANIMAGLSQHPSIVTIHQAAIASDGRPYFVMEYCAKPSLGARFRNERISVAETLRTGIRVASAVETAHRLGVLHRDIKPANILATDFGWPALTDFGIAGTVGGTLMASGMSIPWAPPELLHDDPYGDARSDVYSLAATLYSLLAGRSPYEIKGQSNSPVELITRIERDPLRPVDRVDVPHELHTVLARAMSKEPEHRFSSALGFAHALQNIEREMQLPVTGIDVTDMGPVRYQTSAHSGQASSAARPESGSERSLTVVRGQESSSAQSPSAGSPAAFAPALPAVPPPPTEQSPTDADDEATNLRGILSVDPENAAHEPTAADIETRLRPVTTIHADRELAVPELSVPESEALPTWSAVAAQREAEAQLDVKQFDETTGSNGYFYAKRREADLESRKAGKRTALFISFASILVLVGIMVYIGLQGLSQEPLPQPTTHETSGNEIQGPDTASVPAVTDLKVAESTPTAVRFTWVNPEPQDGDAFVWRVVDVDTTTAATRTTDRFVVVPRQDEAQRVCVEVSLVRSNGKVSHTPTRECS
ncbi:serine/threonine protein kinase [Timonella sp. A28]|uniref:serine/threonine protein kinase n=1 Tax=Timonella sp. A28 TaxID=3442640 RepID=UPI003EB6E488